MAILRPGSFVGLLTTLEILDLPVEDRKAPNFVYDTTANELRGYVVPGEAYPSLLMSTGGPSPGNNLDEAYDDGGPGAGRQITVDAGPVWLDGSGVAGNTAVLDIDGHEILRDQAADPGAAVAGQGFVYSKDVGGNSELFWMNTAGVVQITGGGSLFHSLDDAYNDGRQITVDAGPVELILDATGDGLAIENTTTPITGTKNFISLTGDLEINNNVVRGLSVDVNTLAATAGANQFYGGDVRFTALTGKAVDGYGYAFIPDGDWDAGADLTGFYANFNNNTFNSAGMSVRGFWFNGAVLTNTDFAEIYGMHIQMPDDATPIDNPIYGIYVEMPATYSGNDMEAARFEGNNVEATIINENREIFKAIADNITASVTAFEGSLTYNGLAGGNLTGMRLSYVSAGASTGTLSGINMSGNALAGLRWGGIRDAVGITDTTGLSHYGYLIEQDGTLNHANANYRGIVCDLTYVGGFTLTNFAYVYGVHVLMPNDPTPTDNPIYGMFVEMPTAFNGADMAGARLEGEGYFVEILSTHNNSHGIYIGHPSMTTNKSLLQVEWEADATPAGTSRGLDIQWNEANSPVCTYEGLYISGGAAAGGNVVAIDENISVTDTTGETNRGILLGWGSSVFNNAAADFIGIYGDFDSFTITNALNVYGISIDMPAAYTAALDIVAAKFTGDGSTVELCSENFSAEFNGNAVHFHLQEAIEHKLEILAADPTANAANLARIWYNSTDRQVKAVVDDGAGGYTVVILG